MFEALPRVRIYLVFNYADEDFPADCSLMIISIDVTTLIASNDFSSIC
jgi:hypothetical protein